MQPQCPSKRWVLRLFFCAVGDLSPEGDGSFFVKGYSAETNIPVLWTYKKAINSGKEDRSAMKKRITAMLIVLMMLLGMMPGKTWADMREYNYQIGGFIDGLVDGKMMVGHTISFNIDEVIASNTKMMGIYLLYGDPWIYNLGGTSESLDYTYTPDAKGNVSWNIPDYPSLGGEKIQIVIRFGMLGEDSDIFLSEEFTICTDISNASITDKTYTGDPIKQSLVVETTSRTFKEGTNYTVSYKNNVNAGTASVTITGKEGLVGSVTKTFKINKAANLMTAQNKTVKVKASKIKNKKQVIKCSKSMGICTAVGKLQFKLAKVNKKKFKKFFKVNAKNGNIIIKKGLKKGTYKLKINVTAAGNANYLAATKQVMVTIKVK